MDTVNTVRVKNQLEEILQDLGIPRELIHANALINRDLQLDSTEIVEISLALKQRLGIKVKLESRQDKTLAEVTTLIASAMTKQIDNQDKI